MARSGIAIVGMAGRFAESEDLGQLWKNLKSGRECVGRNAHFDEAAAAKGAGHWVEQVSADERIRMFDRSLFGLSPRETERLEPQQRHFLELAWEALEDGGYSVDIAGPNVGVFGGANFTSYYSLTTDSHLPAALDEMIGADKDYLATRVSHHLGLQGPAITVQSACSTSLVAVHLACQSLLSGECDAALAGGISITRPLLTRYFYTPGGILSPDGYCRAFDADALGTVFTDGGGVVLLMRIEDALSRRHPIHAVIRGSAVNNDGGGKASYMAPSIAGQERVIRSALRSADVTAADVGYVEAHGTATVIGDAIELAALTRVFRSQTDEVGACHLGSVKTNIGHTASAAGVAGLIKAALALKHELIPPNVNFRTPNPDLDFETSPFFVSAEPHDWPRRDGLPRLAGVSSFGVGGTNAHVVLEEPPRPPKTRARRAAYILTLSARSESALAETSVHLRRRLSGASRRELADIAYTLNVGRKGLEYRAAIVCSDAREAREALAGRAQSTALGGRVVAGERVTAFMFPGQGSQYVGMGRQLYEQEARFRTAIDDCLEILAGQHELDFTPFFRSRANSATEINDETIAQTRVAQPLIFVVEYALGVLLMSWGVKPKFVIGHSIGEFAAACLAGVFSLEHALKLVVLRGALMQQLPPGAMLSVAAPRDAFKLPKDLDLAAINGPRQCVVSGPAEAVDAFAADLTERQIPSARLRTSHAFHSRMMNPMLKTFGRALADVQLRPPTIPLISNVTGGVVPSDTLCDPAYWTRHIRQPVLFTEGLQTLVRRGVDLLVEVGPGRQLSGLAQQNGLHRQQVRIINTMNNEGAVSAELAVLSRAMSRLWLEGGLVDWPAVHRGEERRMVSLPAYPFDREEFRTEPAIVRPAQGREKLDVVKWLYLHTWQRFVPSPTPSELGDGDCWLVIEGDEEGGHAGPIAERLIARGEAVVRVRAGDGFSNRADRMFTADPASVDDLVAVFKALEAKGITVSRVVHAWGLESPAPDETAKASFEDENLFRRRQTRGICNIARCLKAHREVYGRKPVTFEILTSGAQEVTGGEILRPGAASAVSFARVAPQENLHVTCRVIDVDPALLADVAKRAYDQIVEMLFAKSEQVVALRQDYWWVQGVEKCPIVADRAAGPRLKPNGIYLITGGMGQIGLIFARHLAEKWNARLVLAGRSPVGELSPATEPLDAEEGDDAEEARPRSTPADRLAELNQLGGEALYVQADVSNPDDVTRLRAEIHERFGGLDGIIFGAGTLAARAAIDDVGEGEIYDENYAGKVHGLQNVLDAFGDDPLDFGVVLSSVSTVLGGAGLGPYSAANHVADALILKHRRAGHLQWSTTNWDVWGDGHLGESDPRFALFVGMAIQPEEGAQALEDILSLPQLPQFIVSTHDLQVRIDLWIKRQAMISATPLVQHKRPSLTTAFVEPQGELERQIGAVWSRVLGIENIGRDDDFFEMGGHSILAVQTAVQIQEFAPPDAPGANLYENPTIRLLAVALRQPVVPVVVERVKETAPARTRAKMETINL